METAVVAALVGAVGALVSGALALWIAVRSKRLDLELERTKLWVSAYDKVLLEQRLPDYRALWALTEPTSRQNVFALSPEAASALAQELTHWYYQGGGILLSEEARNAFFSARESLAAIEESRIPAIVQSFSSLRSALCMDLNSRRAPTLVAEELAVRQVVIPRLRS